MAVTLLDVLGNAAQNTFRGPSETVWQDCNWGNLLVEPQRGMTFFDDFRAAGLSPATGSAANFDAEQPWYAYLDTNGAITDSGIEGGGIHLAASTTAGQGVALGQLTNGFKVINSSGVYYPRIWFECRVNLSTAALLASKADMFVGLVDGSGLPASVVPITATPGLLAVAAGFIGFHKRGGATNGTDWNLVYNVAGGTPVYVENLLNLVTTVTGTAPVGGTYYKLGFLYDPNASQARLVSSAATGQTAGLAVAPLLRVFVNGLEAATFLSSVNIGGTAFPTTFMSPAIAWKQQSTTAAVSGDVDWIRVAQMAYS